MICYDFMWLFDVSSLPFFFSLVGFLGLFWPELSLYCLVCVRGWFVVALGARVGCMYGNCQIDIISWMQTGSSTIGHPFPSGPRNAIVRADESRPSGSYLGGYRGGCGDTRSGKCRYGECQCHRRPHQYHEGRSNRRRHLRGQTWLGLK